MKNYSYSPAELLLSLALFLLATTIGLIAQTPGRIFVPPAAENNLNGNGAFAPFATPLSGRFQQVYDASAFPTLGQEGGFITAFCFRLDAEIGRFFDIIIPDIQVNLSTTSRSLDGLSPVFEDNIGMNDTVVLGRGPMHLVGFTGGFDVCFGFHTNPYFYNPAQGNLLIDFRIYSGAGFPPSGGSPLDAFDVPGDSVSSVFALHQSSLPTVGQASSLGLATAFFVIPVPEPSTWALLGLGLGALGWRWFRRRKE